MVFHEKISREVKRPMDLKSIVLTFIAVVGFLKGCGNDFISANPEVQEIRTLKETVARLEEANKSLDHNVRELEKFKSWLEGKLDAKIH